ncbi:MAG TPA: Ldh family oxidoreductase [Galbitalea sp.]|jgi:LDH2 family malate/lactate/ureidoglycolate dehydrogenase|nr:Ldh family oxidoreductase [Galbitalea sp.]
MLIETDDLRRWACDVFVAVGLSLRDAETTVDNLIFAERRGVRTHGFMRLPIYVERILGGGIDPHAETRIERDLGALAILDAGNGIGAVSGRDATQLAIERASRYGIGCAIVSRANHFGAAAYYANLMADAGLFGIAVCNTDKAMGPPFGGRPVLGTNPVAMAVPLPAPERPQLDMATSEASFGKVLLAVQDKREIPLGWAVDSRGRPTTSATDAVEGALLPTGGPKGFGLAFMIDALVALSGASVSPEAMPMYGDRSQPQKLGLAFIAIRADAAVSPDDYAAAIRGLVSAVHASGPGPTGVDALAPGEPELAKQASAGSAIKLSDELRDDLRRIGKLTSVDLS